MRMNKYITFNFYFFMRKNRKEKRHSEKGQQP